MTKEEMIVILGILKTTYPRFYMNMTKREAEQTIDLWTEMFNDIDVNILKVAVKSLISHFEYPPTIADVRKEVSKILTPREQQLTTDEAWGQVVNAIRNFGVYRQEDALNSMSPSVAKVMRNLYKEFCQSENQMADRSHFMKMYENSQKRIEEEKVIPLEIKNVIEKISENQKNIVENFNTLKQIDFNGTYNA